MGIKNRSRTPTEFADGLEDGPIIVYDEPNPDVFRAQIEAVDLPIRRAFQRVSDSILAGPRPDVLCPSLDLERLVYALQVIRVANDVQSEGLRTTVPPYAFIVQAALEMLADRGPSSQLLRIGDLFDAGYEVLLRRKGHGILAYVGPLATGTRAPIGVAGMLDLGFPSCEVVRTMLGRVCTPEAAVLGMLRGWKEN